MTFRHINWNYFENVELFVYMQTNQYPFEIHDNKVYYKLDLFKYISLHDLIVAQEGNQFISASNNFLDQVSQGIKQVINDLNQKNLQYFIPSSQEIYIQIDDGQFKRIVLTHLTSTKQQRYQLELKQLTYIEKKTQIWFVFYDAIFRLNKQRNIEFSQLFQTHFFQIMQDLKNIILKEKFAYLKPIENLSYAYVFHKLINQNFDYDDTQYKLDTIIQIFKAEDITKEIIIDFMSQRHNQIKFNNVYYVFDNFLFEMARYSRIYKKQQQRQLEREKRKRKLDAQDTQNIIQELLNQLNQIIDFDKELFKDILEFNWDLSDNEQQIALLSEVQKRITQIINREVMQIV